ncbi:MULTISPECIES: hypothetical protein [unclassified Sphingopyxis]|uniref:hypothetical protein n=1 Tax=unclassified Sphingopyxis TaxID=2614943 RepID=UPI0012E36F70|nr:MULTISPECIES: hypothetical protein [unclassified Sphingopyxis]
MKKQSAAVRPLSHPRRVNRQVEGMQPLRGRHDIFASLREKNFTGICDSAHHLW